MSNIETLEQDAIACELHCPHGPDSREAKLERDFIAALNTTEDGMRKFAKSFSVDLGDIPRVKPVGHRSYG